MNSISPYRPHDSMCSCTTLFVELVCNILYFNNYVVSVGKYFVLDIVIRNKRMVFFTKT